MLTGELKREFGISQAGIRQYPTQNKTSVDAQVYLIELNQELHNCGEHMWFDHRDYAGRTLDSLKDNFTANIIKELHDEGIIF